MKEVWVAYTDGYYSQWGSGYVDDKDVINIKGIFDTELTCRRFCMENNNNFKCKKFQVRIQEEEVGEPTCEI